MSKDVRIDAASSDQLGDIPMVWRVAIMAGLALSPAATALAQTPAVHPFIPVSNFVIDISSAPWQVALVDGPDSRRSLFCGGSLVAPNWVVTGAQCVDNFTVQMDPNRFGIVAGTLTYKAGGVRSDIDKIFVHPRWKQTQAQYDFDAALLKLKTPVSTVAPVKLIAPAGTLPEGPSVRVTGWGLIRQVPLDSDKLRFVDVPVVSNAECNKPESYDGRVSAQMFCAGVRVGGLDSCQGDGGGPVVSFASGTGELVGIVSWGFGCAHALQYGVYTRISAVSQWASDTMAGN
jgi:secreted trypsin-like serine protease